MTTKTEKKPMEAKSDKKSAQSKAKENKLLLQKRNQIRNSLIF
ncbi:hypothetical protein [Bacteroides faecichinchillae]|nr:hypothetical protein [Bacteroides faecichinchillae]